MPFALRLLRLFAVLLAGALPAAAQGLFAPAVTVDERAITEFEVQQRMQMLQVFRTPGDLREAALDALIDERLQMTEAARLGITVGEADLNTGMDEFAGRANLSGAELIEALAAAGVAEETYRDFVRAGILWRRVVRARFGDRVSIRPIEIDRAAAEAPPQPGLRVLLSELILPANTPDASARVATLTPQITAIRSFDAFSDAARDLSVSVSRDRGGRLDWLDVGGLPPPIRQEVLSLQPGEVAGPVPIPNAAVFFQLRQIDETAAPADTRDIDFAALYLPGGRTPQTLARAAGIAAEVDTCDDLYGVAQGLPLQRDSLPPSRIPGDVALQLAGLDEGEISTALTRSDGQTLVLLMLCARGLPAEDEIDRDAIQSGLFNQRLGGLARNYLADLRANAAIVRR